MSWSREEALTDPAISEPMKFLSEFRFSLRDIPVEITIRLYQPVHSGRIVIRRSHEIAVDGINPAKPKNYEDDSSEGEALHAAVDDKALSNFRRNAAGTEIKHLVFIDLPGSCAVGATNIVGEDLQSRHRIRLGIIAQKKIANFLVSIREMGMRFDADESAESATGSIVERVFVE